MQCAWFDKWNMIPPAVLAWGPAEFLIVSSVMCNYYSLWNCLVVMFRGTAVDLWQQCRLCDLLLSASVKADRGSIWLEHWIEGSGGDCDHHTLVGSVLSPDIWLKGLSYEMSTPVACFWDTSKAKIKLQASFYFWTLQSLFSKDLPLKLALDLSVSTGCVNVVDLLG